jgi:hypothetical protein
MPFAGLFRPPAVGQVAVFPIRVIQFERILLANIARFCVDMDVPPNFSAKTERRKSRLLRDECPRPIHPIVNRLGRQRTITLPMNRPRNGFLPGSKFPSLVGRTSTAFPQTAFSSCAASQSLRAHDITPRWPQRTLVHSQVDRMRAAALVLRFFLPDSRSADWRFPH